MRDSPANAAPDRTPIMDIPSSFLGRANPVLTDHLAGTGGDSDPSMAGANSGYPRLEGGAVGIAPWQQ